VIALLQGGHYALFEDAFQQGQLWPALSIALKSPDSEHSAMLVIRALTIEGEVDCSELSEVSFILNLIMNFENKDI